SLGHSRSPINGKSRRWRLGHVISCVQSQLITSVTLTAQGDRRAGNRHSTVRTCTLMISVAPAVPAVNAHQCFINAHISAYQCTSMPHISAHLSCLSVPLISAANKCHLSVPVSAAYQCQSVPPISASQCRLTVPVSAA
ncbi:unnamed protein product, partial [Staurois parvus]